jgi:hypothetical protein
MRKSELLDSFVKIATDKGLLSEKPAKPVKPETPQRSDVFERFAEIMKEAYPDHAEHDEKMGKVRWDSLSIDQIGKLYNVKQQLPDDMKYEHNIMEDAHPDSLVISPAHDKLNGLIENNIEGQNIRIRTVIRMSPGQLTHHKYAKKNLMLSLVSLANKLDNEDQQELCKLADTCLVQVGAPLQKTAVWGIVIGLAGAALAALYAKQHLRMHSDGFAKDYEKASSEIDDLLNSNTNFGVGYAYTPEFIQTVNHLKTVLAELNTEVQKIIPVLDKLETPHTKPELEQMLQQPDVQEVPRLLDEYHQEISKVRPFLQTVISSFSNEGYKQRSIADKGALSSLVDATEFLHGGKGLVADDFDDVVHALQTLMVDVNNIDKTLRTYKDSKQVITQQLTDAAAEDTKMTTEQPTATPTETAAEPAAGSAEEGIGELAKGLI